MVTDRSSATCRGRWNEVNQHPQASRRVVHHVQEDHHYVIRWSALILTIKNLLLYPDLINSKMNNHKYLALWVCFNTSTRFNIGYNLAVRRFAPTTDERQAEQLSTILHEWSSSVLEEFSIKVMFDVLTSILDSWSNVKRTLDIMIDAWWEWCISHLIHLALTEMFGTSIDPNNSKNVERATYSTGSRRSLKLWTSLSTCREPSRKPCLNSWSRTLNYLTRRSTDGHP